MTVGCVLCEHPKPTSASSKAPHSRGKPVNAGTFDHFAPVGADIVNPTWTASESRYKIFLDTSTVILRERQHFGTHGRAG